MTDAYALAIIWALFWNAEMPCGLVLKTKLTIGASYARPVGAAYNIIMNNDSAYSFIEINLK